MVMKKLIAVIVLGLMLTGVASTASAVAVFITGSTSCGVWVNSRTNNTAVQWMGWFEGYLSGLSMGTKKSALEGTDNQSIFLWMDNYCRANPLKDVKAGGQVLFWELVEQKGL